MKDLDMCVAIAKLESTDITLVDTGFCSKNTVCKYKDRFEIYNPITDPSLTIKFIANYDVDIQHCTQFDCGIDGDRSFDIPFVTASTQSISGDFRVHSNTPLNDDSQKAIQRAVVECILRANGLYK